MKKRILMLLMVLAIVISMCPMQTLAVNTQTIAPGDTKNVTLAADQKITYTFVPTETAEYTFWNASNNNSYYCYLYEDGTTLTNGNAHFAFVAKAGSVYEFKVISRNNQKASYELHLEKNVPANSVKMRESHVILLKGERRSFPLTFDPVNSIRGEYSWSLSDNNVATIASQFNSGCDVVGNAAGTTTMTVNVGNVTTSCEITVVDPAAMDQLNPGDAPVLNMDSGAEQWYRFNATEAAEYTFWDGSRDWLSYESWITCWRVTEDSMMKLFEGNGVIPLDAKPNETYIFHVTNRWPIPHTFHIHLEKNVPAESVSLPQSSYTLIAGADRYIPVSPQFIPVNSIRTGFVWEVEDPDVVEILRVHANACEIVPKQVGSTTLTGAIGDKTVTCQVQVVEPEAFSAGEIKTIEMAPGAVKVFQFDPIHTAQYTLWNEPGFKGYFFTIYEGNRAMGNGNCPVAFDAQSGMTYFIHVRNEGAEAAAYEMHLEENVPVVSVSMDKEWNIVKGGHAFVELHYTPLNSIRGDVQWYVDDPTVVALRSYFDGGCNIEAVGLGSATLTAKVGGQTLTCKITVSCSHQNINNNVCEDCGIRTGKCGENLSWTLSDDGELVISGTGSMAEYAYNELPWSYYRNDITKIVVEDGVESISAFAFLECHNVTEVNLPNSVTGIGMSAFRFCSSLKTVDLPDSMTSLASNLFSGCDGLGSIEIPAGVTSIGESAFNGCTNLKSVVIPAKVTILEKWAFSGCISMKEIEFTGNAPTIAKDAFTHIVGTACYPGGDPTWTADKLQNYGGTITWESDGPAGIQFTDVPANAFYANAVQWAVEENVTTGLSATSFGPDAPCTRSQIVTFLWRAAGEPEPDSGVNPFTDVNPTDFYYKAVLWAVEEGITTGLSATSFGPNAPCTRGQVATFLWRYAGEPAPADDNPFSDVAATDYCYKAVLWAVENDVTTGVGGGRFAPNDTCTRGQIVTFLYRAFA